jgi:negative regulator of flagellin synthesis FlgM
MSYSSGISNIQQQAIDSIATSEAKPVTPVTNPASSASTGEGQIANVEHADQAELSSTGGLVAQALEGSDVRSAKVASLQQAIASGSYNVPSSDVADKIIQSLLD